MCASVLSLLSAACATARPSVREAVPAGVIRLLVDPSSDTPPGDDIYLTGSINAWQPGADDWRLSLRDDGRYQIDIPADMAKGVEFKFTRGNWDTVEKDSRGREIKNRRLSDRHALVELKIQAWRDSFEKVTRDRTITGTVIERRDLRIHSLNRQAVLYIYLPPDYDSSEKRYPVFYMHDGQNLFDNATANKVEWNVDEYLESAFKSGTSAGMIVVGVACSGDRMNEYSPFRDRTFAPDPKGERYIQWLVSDLKPLIDSEYRTLSGPEHTLIGGSSMGALISLYAALSNPGVFGGVLCMSSAFWIGDRSILGYIRENPPHGRIPVYLDIGTREWRNLLLDAQMVEHSRQVRAALLDAGTDPDDLLLVIEDGAVHDEFAWSRRFPGAFEWLQERLQLP